MLTQNKISAKHPSTWSIWSRCCAVVCMGLILMAASVEACHFHAPGSQSGPDHCPLCIALHPALPTTATVARMVTLEAPEFLAPQPLRQYHRIWVFDLSSRPPPAA